MRKKLLLSIVSLFLCIGVQAQILEPVKWKVSLQGEGQEKEIVFHAFIEDGWHLYATDIPQGGPIPTSFSFDELSQVSLKGEVTPAQRPHEEYSSLFDMKLGWYNSKIDFKQALTIDDPDNFKITGYITYQACNDVTCLPPTKYEFSFGESQAEAAPAPVMTPVAFNTKSSSSRTDQPGWQPVIEQIQSMDSDGVHHSDSLWFIFLSGFVGGLLALLTPCVWPMIPLTVSFFLKKQQSRRKAIGEAILILIVACGIISINGDPSEPCIWRAEFLWLDLYMTADSFNQAWLVMIRAVAGITVMMAFATSTPIPHLAQALRQIRIPDEICEIVVLIYRYAFLLLERMDTMWSAAGSRLGFSGIRRSISTVASIAVGIFTSSMNLADKAQVSLECRGYRGYFPIYNRPQRAGIGWISVAIVAFALLYILGIHTEGVVDFAGLAFGA